MVAWGCDWRAGAQGTFKDDGSAVLWLRMSAFYWIYKSIMSFCKINLVCLKYKVFMDKMAANRVAGGRSWWLFIPCKLYILFKICFKVYMPKNGLDYLWKAMWNESGIFFWSWPGIRRTLYFITQNTNMHVYNSVYPFLHAMNIHINIQRNRNTSYSITISFFKCYFQSLYLFHNPLIG